MKRTEFIARMEEIAPVELAEDFDSGRIGLLVEGKDEIEKIEGKRVLIVDDVISTGESLEAVRKLVSEANGIEACACAVLAEGDAADRDDIIFLDKLPLFFK